MLPSWDGEFGSELLNLSSRIHGFYVFKWKFLNVNSSLLQGLGFLEAWIFKSIAGQ